jgi:hypothetical protein
MEHNNLSLLYSELSLNPDLPTLAERCKLLTEILLDCKSLPQTQPVCRCLRAWLEDVKSSLTESMRDFQVVEFEGRSRTTETKRVVSGRYRNEMRLLPGVKPCAAGVAF